MSTMYLFHNSLVGHLIECGAQCTGGIFTDWQTVPDWYEVLNICFKVMLHGTICNDDFWCNTALQCWNNVAGIQNNVTTIYVAMLCWAKNCHYESSHVTLPIVVYLILLFIPLARCGRIGNSFTRTSCGKSNVTCGKSTLNSVNLHGNLLCLRVIGDKSQFFTDICMVYKCL